MTGMATKTNTVIPAEAGISLIFIRQQACGIPAFAGMTEA
jgi:hypothetical protein